VNLDNLIPIYSGTSSSDPRKNKENIPKRPQGERMEPPPQTNNGNFQNENGFGFSFGFGAFPGMYFNWVFCKCNNT